MLNHARSFQVVSSFRIQSEYAYAWLSQGQLGSVLSSENQPPSSGNIQNDGASPQGDSGNVASDFHSGSVPMGYYAFQKDNVFPERPGQPECQFYMKTGDCKFGAVCKFHHPKERLLPVPDCLLSPIGLPLRPVSHSIIFLWGLCINNSTRFLLAHSPGIN